MSAPVDPKKFDPARAAALDAPERERYLPNAAIVDLLMLGGGEVVVDYGAGTGRLSVPIAQSLPEGRVVAVDESPPMVERLRAATLALANVQALLIEGNSVPLAQGSVDRILALNLLHEVRGEGALDEMLRLLKPTGALLMIDWERGRERDFGPPDEILYNEQEAQRELSAAGFSVEALAGAPFVHHFALRARPLA